MYRARWLVYTWKGPTATKPFCAQAICAWQALHCMLLQGPQGLSAQHCWSWEELHARRPSRRGWAPYRGPSQRFRIVRPLLQQFQRSHISNCFPRRTGPPRGCSKTSTTFHRQCQTTMHMAGDQRQAVKMDLRGSKAVLTVKKCSASSTAFQETDRPVTRPTVHRPPCLTISTRDIS